MKLEEHILEGPAKRIHDLVARFGDVRLFRSNERPEVMRLALCSEHPYDPEKPRFLLTPHDRVTTVQPGEGACDLTTYVTGTGQGECQAVILIVKRDIAELAIRLTSDGSTAGILKTLGWTNTELVANAA